MAKFIEINENLIDIDEIKACYFKDNGSNSIDFHITFKDNTTLNLSTNRFWNNSYEHSCNNQKGYEKIKKYLLKLDEVKVNEL